MSNQRFDIPPIRSFIPFTWFTNIQQTSGQVEILPNCNGISFTNLGDSIVNVDGKTLYPGTVGSILGDSFTIGGNQGEVLNKRRISVAFTAGGTVNKLEVIQKVYEL